MHIAYYLIQFLCLLVEITLNVLSDVNHVEIKRKWDFCYGHIKATMDGCCLWLAWCWHPPHVVPLYLSPAADCSPQPAGIIKHKKQTTAGPKGTTMGLHCFHLGSEVGPKGQIYRLVTQDTDDYIGTRGWSHGTNIDLWCRKQMITLGPEAGPMGQI